MRSKYLFVVTAVVEAGTGMALVLQPSVPVALLLGSPLSMTAEVTLGRIAGAALLSLGLACWLARNDEHSRAATGLIVSMLLYNTAAVAVLAYTGVVSQRVGVALWPGVLLHTVLAAWCVARLRTRR
jgi:putative effector of murein hydrolase LrgA (UPF0299 family)